MPLTDTKVRALHGRMLKGENVGKASDGGGLNFQGGKYWRFTALGVYPNVSLMAVPCTKVHAWEIPSAIN